MSKGLDTINIENYDLLGSQTGPIYKYCVSKNIKTLGELIKKVDNSKPGEVKDEILGFIDLVKLRHQGIDLPYKKLLFCKAKLISNFYKGKHHPILEGVIYTDSYFKNPLQRLGFSIKETEILEDCLRNLKETKLVIDIIYNCVNTYNKNKFKNQKLKDSFEKKLNIYITYYMNRCMEYDAVDINRAIEVENLLRAKKDLIMQNKLVDEHLKEVLEKEINKRIDLIPEVEVKKLIKKYEDK